VGYSETAPRGIFYRQIKYFYAENYLKNREKKWHRLKKMDKNKCPILKSAKEILQRPSLKKTGVSIMQ